MEPKGILEVGNPKPYSTRKGFSSDVLYRVIFILGQSKKKQILRCLADNRILMYNQF